MEKFLQVLEPPTSGDDDDVKKPWDSTFHEIGDSFEVGRSTVSPHAVGFGDSIFCPNDATSWSWNVSVDPYSKITLLSSNADGSIVVAATSSNKMVLLRGLDGQELARRTETVQQIQWMGPDKLWMETANKIIVVSNIQGDELNHPHDETIVRKAIGKITISEIPVHDLNFYALTILSSLRVVACTESGDLQVFDCVDNSRLLPVPSEGITSIPGIDCSTGLKVQHGPRLEKALVVGSLSNETSQKMFWFDPKQLKLAHDFVFDEGTVLKFEPINSFDNERASALGVILKTPTKTLIQILQLVVDEDGALSLPHVIYAITETPSVNVDFSSVPFAPYAVRYKLWSETSKFEYKCFQPDRIHANAIGLIRSSLCRGEIDAAADAAKENREILSEEFSDFHPSEVVWERLLLALEHENPALVQACLKEFTAEAVSGGQGLHWLLRAVDLVRTAPITSSVEVFMQGLKFLCSLLKTVLENRSLASSESKLLNDSLSLVDRQSRAVNFLICKKVKVDFAFHEIRSLRHMYTVFIKEGRFDLAHTLCMETARSGDIDTRSIILAFLKLDSSTPPAQYFSFIRDVIFPRLVDGDRITYQLKDWACRTADVLDSDHHDLDSSISLLEFVDQQVKILEARTHASFGQSSPFIEQKAENERERSTKASVPSSSRSRTTSFTFNPTPTVLEVSTLRGGALRADSCCTFGGDTTNVHSDCVSYKLQDANFLRQARSLGVPQDVATLRGFNGKDDRTSVFNALIGLLCASSESHTERSHSLNKVLRPLCEAYSSSFDKCILEYARGLCQGIIESSEAIEESCSIARCCSSKIESCQVVLLVIGAARLSGRPHPDVQALSKEAIIWASCDNALRSELEEAARLLRVDGIIVKYCGQGARELFLVQNPRHSKKLLEYITSHVGRKAGILEDTLLLCDAFQHLSKEIAVRRLLETAVLLENSEPYVKLFQDVAAKDPVLAATTLAGIVAFAHNAMFRCPLCTSSERNDGEAQRICQRVCLLLSSAVDLSLSLTPDLTREIKFLFWPATLDNILRCFIRAGRLHQDHNVNVSVAELSDVGRVLDLSRSLLADVVSGGSDRELTKNNLAPGKIAVSMLADRLVDERVLWHICMLEHVKEVLAQPSLSLESSVELLSEIGLLSSGSYHSSCALLSLVSSLCSPIHLAVYDDLSSANPMNLVLSLSILQDWAIMSCPDAMLPRLFHSMICLETVCLTLFRCDEPVGEAMENGRDCLQTLAASYFFREENVKDIVSFDLPNGLNKPTLHGNWNVQDGLLLPTRRSIFSSVEFCTRADVDSKTHPSFELFRLVSDQGAHYLSMKVLLTAFTICGSLGHDAACVELEDATAKTVAALAERSLGGTGSGITSSIVDSQCALVFLVSQPMKEAFSRFSSCLPNAIQAANYKRFLALANVGIAASTPRSSNMPGRSMLAIGWCNQSKFHEQCSALANKAMWWWVLRDSGVSFSTQEFQDNPRRHASSLLSQILDKLKAKHSMQEVSRLATEFSLAFGLKIDKFTCRFVESLLRPETNDISTAVSLRRRAILVQNEKLVLSSLRRLDCPLKRVAILRICLVSLESCPRANKDYEIYRLVLSLYQEMLENLLDTDLSVKGVQPDPFDVELELVTSRIDVLEILISFFDGPQLQNRPSFPAFFEPLSAKFDHQKVEPALVYYDILCGAYTQTNHFDPLAHIADSLQLLTSASVSALAPIGDCLGLPSGAIAARHLIAKFHRSNEMNHNPPSFDHDVAPVLKKVLDARDRRRLAEWCSDQYKENEMEMLKCLDVVVESATEESHGAEKENQTAMNEGRRPCPDKEQRALELMKAKIQTRDWLSESLKVKSILREGIGSNAIVERVIEALINELSKKVEASRRMNPEELVDFLLVTGSSICCTQTLSPEGFPIPHIRSFCSVVQSACRFVADQHSHLNASKRAQSFAHRWLSSGEPSKSVTIASSRKRFPVRRDTPKAEEEKGFVMDLSKLQSTDTGAWIRRTPEDEAAMAAHVEESSALTACSKREVSEIASIRTALRVAFVLAFSGSEENHEMQPAKENFHVNTSQEFSRPGLLPGKTLRKMGKSDDEAVRVCSDLLGITFAASINANQPKAIGSGTLSQRSYSGGPATITFAMRHRALRAAVVLCPQSLIEEISENRGFLSNSEASPCSLGMCTFGLFIAKEMEEMGLSLPHSDLQQLSTMNFLSNAKALWRRHRTDSLECRGRLLLLLVEMGLRSVDIDYDFLDSLFREMNRLVLPRTLLISLERFVESHHFPSPSSLDVPKQGLSNLIQQIKTELLSSSVQFSDTDATATLERLSTLVSKLYNESERIEYFSMLSRELERTQVGASHSGMLA